jgi:hypothetical protein
MGKELVKQTGASQLYIGNVNESNEEGTFSPCPSDPLWIKIASADAIHLAEGKRMRYLLDTVVGEAIESLSMGGT